MYLLSLKMWQALGNMKPQSLRIMECDMWEMLFGIALHGSPVEKALWAYLQNCSKILDDVSEEEASWFSTGVSLMITSE